MEEMLYPTHALLDEGPHRFRAKPVLEILSHERDFPACVAQEGGTHEVLARLSEGPASDICQGTPTGHVPCAGAHGGVQIVVEDFLNGEIHGEVCLLAKRIAWRNVVIALQRMRMNFCPQWSGWCVTYLRWYCQSHFVLQDQVRYHLP